MNTNSLPLTIMAYFQTLNSGRYQQTADLFSTDGALYSPFENPAKGNRQIVNCLHNFAKGYEFVPERISIECANFSKSKYKIIGEMRNKNSKVGMGWFFLLDKLGKIISVNMIVLAGFEELLQIDNCYLDSISKLGKPSNFSASGGSSLSGV
ncbi:MAG: hypothetical protein Cpurp_06205 [Chlorogloea purpurea SAG 13.99]|nr:hypothetical protein [Chlorogloea purpurea SAG 13.99]